MRAICNRVPVALAITALAVLAMASPSAAQAAVGSVAAEIKAVILENNAHIREHLTDRPGGTSKDGSVEFWSSGGLMQWSKPDAAPTSYERFTLRAKHIKVIELPGGEAAVAMYYSEGSMHPKGGSAVNHYMTRVTEVYVKEDGKWVARAGHWSPIAGGSGTSQTSLD